MQPHGIFVVITGNNRQKKSREAAGTPPGKDYDMKLYGNQGGAYASSSRTSRRRKRRLTGVQRGALLLMASLAILIGTVVAVYRDFVKPVEIRQPQLPPAVADPGQTDGSAFTPPTHVELETQIDQASGETVQVAVEVPASHKEGFYNILLCGTDDADTCTDTILIARLDVSDHSVALLSVPRDTLIYGDYTVPKINSVYGGAGGGTAGIEALEAKLAETLGFQVDGYVLIQLDMFVALVDLLGGVEFDVPQRLYYTDPSQDLYIDLQPGLQTLDGLQAMGLVRFRKGYATQDIMRTQVQQEFLRAAAKQVLSVTTLRKIGALAELFYENVTTDMTLGNLVYFGQELLQCDFDEMFTYTLEGEGQAYVNGQDCYALYPNAVLEVINGYFNPYDTEITLDNVSIRTKESLG